MKNSTIAQTLTVSIGQNDGVIKCVHIGPFSQEIHNQDLIVRIKTPKLSKLF